MMFNLYLFVRRANFFQAGIGIGLVFAALLQGVARNPSLRGQLFSYAILGFAFVEAIGLFDLMVAMMCKYV